MRPAETLMLVAGFARAMYGKWRFRRTLWTLMAIAILAFITIVLMSAVAVGGVYAVYLLVLNQGTEVSTALLAAGLFAISLIGVLLLAITFCVKKMRSPKNSYAREVANAFFDGLFSE